jgi:hypothetical protein
MNILKLYETCVLGLFLALLQGCSIPVMMDDAKVGESTPGRVIVVGKFELVPPMPEIEKTTRRASYYNTSKYINKVYFSATPQAVEHVDESMGSGQWKNTLNATFGETYFKQTDARTTHLNAGVFYVDATSLTKAWLPGGFSFTPPDNAKAVYIGTVRYTRDDFYNISKVQVVDEYKDTKREFEKRFGKAVRLENALLH